MAEEIRWAPRAVRQFEEICEYIARDSEHYAAFFAERINAIVKNILPFPESGRIVPEYKNKNLREKIYQNYRVVYRLKSSVVEIVATLCMYLTHGARQFKGLV